MKTAPGRRGALLAAVLLASVLLGVSTAYEFSLIFQTKCIMEEVTRGMEINGGFAAYDKDNPAMAVPVDVKIEDPKAQVLYQTKASPGDSFRFVAQDDGDCKICFTAKDFSSAQKIRIRMSWLAGAAAHDWEKVAKKDNLNLLQTELLKLEESIHDIHLELQSIRRREEAMRNINESTNARAAWLGICAMVTCVSLSGWQLYFLQRFFRRKKVI